MAGFNPSPPIQFNYKKLRVAPPAQDIVLDTTYPLVGTIGLQNIPSWLNIIYIGRDGNLHKYRLSIKGQAENLTPGSYSQEVEFRVRVQIGVGQGTQTFKYRVNLNVIDTIRLSLSPTVLNFVYTIGGPFPPLHFLEVVSENPWTLVKDQTWNTVDKISGFGNSTIQVGVDVSGIPVGNYSGIIQVDDGYDKRNVTVNLQVKGANTAEEYLTMLPQTVNVVVNQGDSVSLQRTFEVASSQNITIASDAAWAVPEDSILSAGDDLSVVVAIQDTEALPTGTYVANITVESSYSTIVAQIVLTVNETIIDGVASNGFYFADDRNEIKLNSQIPNSELLLEFQTAVGTELHTYKKLAPFFKGVGKSVLGSEAKNLIGYQSFSQVLTTHAKKAVDILSMRISTFDAIKNTTQQTLRKVFENVRVITGATPEIENWLTYMPKTLYSYPKGVIAFNFKADTPPPNIVLSGSVDATISVGLIDGNVFSCFVNLGQFELQAGDVVNIFCGGHVVKVNIRDIEPEMTPLVFLNEWHCPEIFTCAGTLEIVREREQVTANYYAAGKDRREVLESRTPVSYKVNTGFIYSVEEREWLAKILRAPRVWLWIQGKFIEVICTNNDLRPYRTREFYNNYQLNFEKAEK